MFETHYLLIFRFLCCIAGAGVKLIFDSLFYFVLNRKWCEDLLRLCGKNAFNFVLKLWRVVTAYFEIRKKKRFLKLWHSKPCTLLNFFGFKCFWLCCSFVIYFPILISYCILFACFSSKSSLVLVESFRLLQALF